MVAETPDRVQQLEKRVAELELKVRYRDEQLASEREITTKAKKKIKQLLAKLGERDDALAELRVALEASRAAAPAGGPVAGDAERSRGRRGHGGAGGVGSKSGRSSAATSRTSDATGSQSPGGKAGGSGRDLREREEIVLQLEGHLSQMRTNLLDSEREVIDLEARRACKEEEWKAAPESERTVESTQVHWQALSMIVQQIREKRTFAAELTEKTRELEESVARQRALIEGFVSKRGAGGGRRDKLKAKEQPEPAAERSTSQPAPEVACEDEALRAFLEAAGSAAEAILTRANLLAAFEETPPRLSGDMLEDCDPETRTQVLSLFAAWVVVADNGPQAMTLEEVDLREPEVLELTGTLESCGAELEEWDMTRCPMNESTTRHLLKALATQPLCRLNLSYNALGPSGASALVRVAGGWADTLEHLSLEMNGLGDGGCREVAGALECGLLPRLRILELGWNELSAACAPALVALLLPGAEPSEEAGEDAAAPTRTPLPLERLCLGGNRLGSEGASALALAALRGASRSLDLDLSMNHADKHCLAALAEWAEAAEEGSLVGVSLNLEWNAIDDGPAAERLARAAGGRSLALGGDGDRPFVRLANNEFADVEPQQLESLSRGLVTG